MTKKKLLSLVMAAVMTAGTVATLTACGDPEPEVTGIEITTAPTKTHYVLGETFSTEGMVVSKVFDNDKTEEIPATEYTYSPNTALKKSDKVVTVSWESFTAEQKITVTNDIASVEVVSQPTKKDYIAGQEFDPAGMTIKAVLENGDKEETVEVTEDNVTYKTTGLVKSDEHFKMNYGGCDFYVDITVLHGAFVEAEEGQLAGAKMGSQGPEKTAIEKDYANALGNVEDAQGHRGIDKGMNCLAAGHTSCYKGANGCTVDGGRVDLQNYVYDHQEWTETTGGSPAKSGMMQNNHIEFSKGNKMLYRLTADKAGKVEVTFKIANPNVSGSIATETKLNEVIKFTVGTSQVNIPDTVKLAGVDWTQYKSYNNTIVNGKSTDFDVKGDPSKYTGPSCTPVFYWQNVTVEITVQEGINDFTIESLWSGKVRLDSISCNGDEDEIMLNMNTQFKPVVVSGQLKVKDGKVLAGVIVDAQAANYSDDEVKAFLAQTEIKNLGNTTYKDNSVSGDRSAPWTTSRADGGLGYSADPKSYTTSSQLTVTYDSVEKLTEGDFADCFCIWYDITCTNENHEGVFKLSGLNYGTEFENQSWCQNDVLWDGNEDVSNNPLFAEFGGYCYQIYSDTRMEYGSFTINGKTLLLVVQKGSFTGENAVAKLSRKYIAGRTDNDPWLHANDAN